jgi:hypothetical protein
METVASMLVHDPGPWNVPLYTVHCTNPGPWILCFSACSFRWFIVAESTVRWFVVREKHC